jgi:hypothetical protein
VKARDGSELGSKFVHYLPTVEQRLAAARKRLKDELQAELTEYHCAAGHKTNTPFYLTLGSHVGTKVGSGPICHTCCIQWLETNFGVVQVQ